MNLLERMAFMKRVMKNIGMSTKEATKSFQQLGEAFSKAPTISTPQIWSEKVLDEAMDATFFHEYMQQPNIEVTNTYASTTHPEEIQPEDIDRAKEAINRMAERQEEQITQELTESFEMLGDPPRPDFSSVERCPNCMRHTTWSVRDQNTLAICNECQWEFDTWALVNIEFAEMRTQVLELKLRQREQELEQAHIQSELESARNHNTVEPSQVQARSGRNAEIENEIRALMAHRNLNADQMRRLNELIGIVQNSPPPPLHSHPDEYAGEIDRIRTTRTALRPLSGTGVSGDSMLRGSEEMLTFDPAPTELEDSAFVDQEMYEGFGFGGDKKKEEKIKPLDPPKRKLDV